MGPTTPSTNHAVPLRLQAGGEVFLTGARVAGREAIRACVMHGGTTDADIDRIVPAVLAAARHAGRP